MKTTIQEILHTLADIDKAIVCVEGYLPKEYFEGQEPLCRVVSLLEEYRQSILESKVDI